MDRDIRGTTTTALSSVVTDYSVDYKSTDGVSTSGETYYDNPNFTQWNGYYSTIPEFKKPIDCLATWIIGQGYTVQNSRDKVILEHIKGAGEDTFNSILWSAIVGKKVNGDFYAEIVRTPDGILQNLKPLDPSSMRTVFNTNGVIIRYEQRSKTPNGEPKKYTPDKIFHIMNDRVFDNTHGQSVGESVQWVLDAMYEALTDNRRTEHRSTIRVMEVDEDDPTRLAALKRDYATAIATGEVLLVPKGTGAISDFTTSNGDKLAWLSYLENKLYQNLAIPKTILGGTAEATEASSKVAMLVFDPIFIREITELELDIENQLGIKITINKQPSLMDNAQTDQSKNTGQTGFQPNDATAGSGK
jgi:hypothetical protein